MKKSGFLLASLMLALALVVCGSVSQAMAADTIVLKLSHHVPLAHPLQPLSETIAKDVAEKSGGRLKVEVYGAGQLGGLKDNAEGVSYGTIDMALVDYGTMSMVVPAAGVVSLPFIFRDYGQVEAFFDGPIGQKINQEILEKASARVLKMTHSGFRCVVSNKPIEKLEDMKLLKIRVPEIPIYVATQKALGANPTPIPWGEVYTSLQTGVVDACEVPTETIYTSKIYEVTKNILRTNHIYTDIGFMINEGIFQKLPEDLRAILVETINTRVDEHRKAVRENDAAFFNKLVEAGLKPTQADIQPFVEAVAPVWDEFTKKTPGGDELIKEIQALK